MINFYSRIFWKWSGIGWLEHSSFLNLLPSVFRRIYTAAVDAAVVVAAAAAAVAAAAAAAPFLKLIQLSFSLPSPLTRSRKLSHFFQIFFE